MLQSVTERLPGVTTQAFIRLLTPHAVRITHASPDLREPPIDRPWLQHVLVPQPPVNVSDSKIKVSSQAGLISVVLDRRYIITEAEPVTTAINGKSRLVFRLEPGERLYGWGEWFSDFARSTSQIVLKNKESIARSQAKQTYSNIPVFFSSRGYAVFVLNSTESAWDVSTIRKTMEIDLSEPPVDYIVVTGKDLKEVLYNYTQLTGRPPMLPRWALGLWMTSYPQENQERVLELAHRHRERQHPLDVIVLDYHWEDKFHNFKWRKSMFPEPIEMIDTLKEMDIHLGLIFTPFVNSKNQPLKKLALNLLVHNLPIGCENDDERALEEYKFADSKGYFAHPDAEWWFGKGGMVDFTNPHAITWWTGMLAVLYRQGVAFFKNDDGEYLPEDAFSHLGMEGNEYHNVYGFFYGKAIYEGMKSLDKRRAMIYARSVWAGSQRFPGMFLGDQKPTFEHMQATMRAGLNMSLLGFAYWGADVFGLDGKTTPETHMRYAQWALLNPLARYFVRPPVLDDTRSPWSHSPEVEANFKRYTELRYRLLPYYYRLAYDAYTTGMPIVRPMMLEYPDNQHYLEVADQYMLGSLLLIAPVIEEGADSRIVRLPKGEWYDFWTDERLIGPVDREVKAPLNQLPIFVKSGAILPMGPVIQAIGENHYFDRLEVHLYPPHGSRFDLYDDDGRTRAYEDGAYSITPITTSNTHRGLEVEIGKAEGWFPEQAPERVITLVFHLLTQPGRISVDGKETTSFQYSATTRRLTLAIHCPTTRSTLIVIE